MVEDNKVRIEFIDDNNDLIVEVKADVGESILNVAKDNDVDLEGACEASLTCSTCHVIFLEDEVFNQLPEACEAEEDILDVAFKPCRTSRLGCQVKIQKYMEGTKIRVPSATRNMMVDKK